MIIDCHVHLMPKRVREDRSPFCAADPGFNSIYNSDKARMVDEAGIIRYMDESGIDMAVVFGFPWESSENIERNNDEVWEFHQRYPDRIAPFAVLSPLHAQQPEREAERTLLQGFRGIGELAMYHGGWSPSDFEALKPSLEIAAERSAPVLIHVNEPVGHEYPGKLPVDFRGLLRVISDSPGVDFILAHWSGGFFFYALMPEVRKALARTYVDTAASPFLYSSDIFEVGRVVLGSDKILFGSDFPLLPLSRYVKELDKAGVDGEMREKILGGNMARLLNTKEAKGAQ